MIIKENIEIGNKNFIKQYSDIQVMIQKEGTEEIYLEAIDPIEFKREYIETDIPVETDEEEEI